MDIRTTWCGNKVSFDVTVTKILQPVFLHDTGHLFLFNSRYLEQNEKSKCLPLFFLYRNLKKILRTATTLSVQEPWQSLGDTCSSDVRLFTAITLLDACTQWQSEKQTMHQEVQLYVEREGKHEIHSRCGLFQKAAVRLAWYVCKYVGCSRKHPFGLPDMSVATRAVPERACLDWGLFQKVSFWVASYVCKYAF